MYQLPANGSTARGISHIFGKPVPVWHYAGTVWRIGLPLAGRIVDTISGVLDRMEKRGLIDRVLNPTNRRSISVKATKEGLSLKEPVQALIDQLNDQVLSIFSPQEKDELIGLLNRMCDQKGGLS